MLRNAVSRNTHCSDPLAVPRASWCGLLIFRSFNRSFNGCGFNRARTFAATVFARARAARMAISVLLLTISSALGQTPVLTQHYDNARTGQNTNELMLAPASVNPGQFGKLFTQPLDGMEAAQPLYVPGVFIPASNSTHNVVYVATLHDSVYAFDADNNAGGNANPLWHASLIDTAHGATAGETTPAPPLFMGAKKR